MGGADAAGDVVQGGVDKLHAVFGAVLLGDFDEFIDDDCGGRFGARNHFGGAGADERAFGCGEVLGFIGRGGGEHCADVGAARVKHGDDVAREFHF